MHISVISVVIRVYAIKQNGTLECHAQWENQAYTQEVTN